MTTKEELNTKLLKVNRLIEKASLNNKNTIKIYISLTKGLSEKLVSLLEDKKLVVDAYYLNHDSETELIELKVTW